MTAIIRGFNGMSLVDIFCRTTSRDVNYSTLINQYLFMKRTCMYDNGEDAREVCESQRLGTDSPRRAAIRTREINHALKIKSTGVDVLSAATR
jgi:hypothetical protein